MPAFEKQPLLQELLPQETFPGPAASAGGSRPGQKRKCGAPPGNINALKHGFYSRRFTRLEIEDLENALQEGLQDELPLLRVQIHRLACFSGEQSGQKGAFQTLNTFGLCCTLLAMIMKAQRALGGEASSHAQALSEALDGVFKVRGRR